MKESLTFGLWCAETAPAGTTIPPISVAKCLILWSLLIGSAIRHRPHWRMCHPWCSSQLPASFDHRKPLHLAEIGAAAHLRLVRVESPVRPSSGQDHQGLSRHVPKLKGKSPVEEHDEHAVDPFKDGRGVLKDEALLAEENSTWRFQSWGKLWNILF